MKIELSHVSKYYRDGEKSTRGLEDVSLSFETDSSFVVITGESGAGKSTLFRVLTGTEVTIKKQYMRTISAVDSYKF